MFLGNIKIGKGFRGMLLVKVVEKRCQIFCLGIIVWNRGCWEILRLEMERLSMEDGNKTIEIKKYW